MDFFVVFLCSNELGTGSLTICQAVRERGKKERRKGEKEESQGKERKGKTKKRAKREKEKGKKGGIGLFSSSPCFLYLLISFPFFPSLSFFFLHRRRLPQGCAMSSTVCGGHGTREHG